MNDPLIQSILRDMTVEPSQRALGAVALIEAEAKEEFGVPDEVLLDIPLEWQHRVSGLAEQWRQRQHWIAGPGSESIDWSDMRVIGASIIPADEALPHHTIQLVPPHRHLVAIRPIEEE